MGMSAIANLPSYLVTATVSGTDTGYQLDPTRDQWISRVDTGSGYFETAIHERGQLQSVGVDSQGSWYGSVNGDTSRTAGNWLLLNSFMFSGAGIPASTRLSADYHWARTEPCGNTQCDVLVTKGHQSSGSEVWFRRDNHLPDRAQVPSTKAGEWNYRLTFIDWVKVGDVLLPQHQITEFNDVEAHASNTYEILPLQSVSSWKIPTAPVNWRIVDGADHATIAFRLVEDRIVLRASFNGQPEQELIFDTGADFILDKSALNRLHIASEPWWHISGMGSGTEKSGITPPLDLRLGTLELTQRRALTTSMSDLVARNPEKIPDFAGMIGTELMTRFVVHIDFDRNEMTLYPRDSYHYKGNAQPLPAKVMGGRFVVATQLEGDKANLLLDTGTSMNMVLSAPYVRSHNLFNRLRCTRERPIGSGFGGWIFGRRASIETLSIAGVTVPTFGADLTSMRKGMLASEATDGVLGLGVLRRFNLTLDLNNNTVYMEPNSHMRDADTSPVHMNELL
ncbi:aspartyl protease family protein [Silvimonas soli]|uniref:aspartyl protease family protein n=1 Tax=Silvimonas soli TaxID=2980100 RepID=UPI0024B37123|nr:aspartyl protease family protein [Silvimonas soli]